MVPRNNHWSNNHFWPFPRGNGIFKGDLKKEGPLLKKGTNGGKVWNGRVCKGILK